MLSGAYRPQKPSSPALAIASRGKIASASHLRGVRRELGQRELARGLREGALLFGKFEVHAPRRLTSG